MKDVALAIAAAERVLVALARGPVAADPVDAAADLAIAACSAIASQFYAVAAPRSLGLVGCGAIARLHVDAHRVYFAPRDVRCADDDAARAAALAGEVGGRVTSIEEACACDIVCVSPAGVRIARAAVRSGTHINAADPVLDDDLRAIAKLITLPEAVAGLVGGRVHDEITIYVAGRLPAVEAALASRA